MLEFNTSLKNIDLSGTFSVFLICFKKFIKKFVFRCHFLETEIDDNCISKLANVLKINKTLKSIDLYSKKN